MFDENYSKPFHIAGSLSMFLDLDSFVYVMLTSLIIWLLVRLLQKKRGLKRISYITFMSKCTLFCAVPIFLLFLIQLIISGQMVLSNWIICFLPLIYGIIIQLIFYGIKKIKNEKT